MALKRLTVRAFAGLTVWGGFGLVAQAQPPAMKVEDAVSRQPRQPGVVVTTPTPDQLPQCRVEPIPNKADPNRPLGYVVRDPSGNPVRQFVSYDGKNFNIVAFYVNGVEAYREVYPPQAGEPHQYRWLGPNGTKWGLDRDGDGRIDEWVVLSPEELSQELLLAVMTKDAKRAEALTVTKANLDALGLPAAESQKLLGRAALVSQRIAPAADALKLTTEAKWVNVQLNPPQTTPKDAFGAEARDDLVVHKNGTILVQDGKDGRDTKTLQTGELVQIGRAWKLVDGPGTGASEVGTGPVIIDAIKELVASLNKVDEEVPNPPTREALGAYNAKRAALLEQIVAKLPAAQQDLWAKQLVDSLAGAAEVEKPDGPHVKKLKQAVEAQARGANPALAAYSAFRLLQTEHAIDLAHLVGSIDPVQEKWRAGLEKFARDHAASDEAPEAMLRLALSFEHVKDGEAKAKEWYAKLVKDYSRYPHAAKAAGAIKRLESEGKPIELIGTNLANGQPFNCAGLQGRVVIVFYCASWSQSLPDDVKRLQSIVKEYGPKGLEVVTVCLDNEARTAAETVTRFKIPGTHLHAPGGLDASPLASAYGIQVAPHILVVGKDGKITNRSAQSATLEDDVKKLLP